jgi:hypothetical protein
VVYPVLRRRNRGNATLISWSRFLRVLQGRATICRPPRPGGTSAFWIHLFFPFLTPLFVSSRRRKKNGKKFRLLDALGVSRSREII